jgi:hypothetical protein
MVAEPTNLLAAFAAHYLDLGAEEVHLFLDAPDSDTVALLSGIKGVRLTLCTEEFWREFDLPPPDRSLLGRLRRKPRPQGTGKRPPGQVMRQIKLANRAYRACRSDWFFFCDADEFLTPRLGGPTVSEALAAQPADLAFCRPQMAERVFASDRPQQGLFDGYLRQMLPPRPKLIRQIYGDLAPFTTRGLTGHVLSKSFVRTGRDDLRIRLHFPVPFDGTEEARRRAEGTLKPGPFLDDIWLVHYDGMTVLHWTLKLLRFYLDYAPKLAEGDKGVFRRRTPARSAQLNAIYEARGDAAAMDRLTRLITLEPEMLARLQAAGGLLQEVAPKPAAAARRWDNGLSFDAAEFDEALRKRHGALIEEHGLQPG